jgi:hypothetical protein
VFEVAKEELDNQIGFISESGRSAYIYARVTKAVYRDLVVRLAASSTSIWRAALYKSAKRQTSNNAMSNGF